MWEGWECVGGMGGVGVCRGCERCGSVQGVRVGYVFSLSLTVVLHVLIEVPGDFPPRLL